MAATTQDYGLIENAILNNIQIIKNDFMLLHQRQKGMINQLENDFLQAIPEKIKNMSVADFLYKFDGDLNKAFCQLSVVDLNLSQTLSNASTLPLQNNTNFVSNNNKLIYSQVQSSSFMENFPKSNNYNPINSSNSKSILKNSKRKRNEYEQNQKKLLNNLYQTHQNNYSNNKENFSQNGTSQMHFQQQSKQNTAKKNNNTNNNNQNQNTTSKSGKKIWKF
ncbi:hypothetical protein TTHERM_00402060 (macronuclear) [Tetrahymena thermophila SB210]|uniref:Uncharacterized protein n=1 Tax=Tetrahymena thermophila (strain SB210) TaxID=312017 RepID=I7LUI4_TETTS|nr:hypothetical protein TTHERM_00402060 [Tetrahymena thermophila SB210]EAR93834.3 hypothetical protein TTHERM_00402060 [Tetrahymena thermophila SB210]|eukprot:XP_001014079.3 hypothetical protein TTHERM_00402060 [Tetrahymena thermophila SB210]